MDDIGGVVIRVGDETIGEMWSLYDGRDVLQRGRSRSSPRISSTIIFAALRSDTFHVSANTDPKGDRSKRPQDQDPDMLLHLVKETDNGHHRARRQVRDGRRLCQPGLREADHRQLGRRRSCRTTRSDSSATWRRPA